MDRKVNFNLTATRSDSDLDNQPNQIPGQNGTTETTTISTNSVEEIRNFLNKFDDVSSIEDEDPAMYGYDYDYDSECDVCDMEDTGGIAMSEPVDAEFDKAGSLRLSDSENMRKMLNRMEEDNHQKSKVKITLNRKRDDAGDFIVKYYENGKFNDDKSYYTDDWDDAVETMKQMKKEAGISESFDYRDEDCGPKDPNDYDHSEGSIVRHGKKGHSKKSNYEVNNQGDNPLPLAGEDDKMFEARMLDDWSNFKKRQKSLNEESKSMKYSKVMQKIKDGEWEAEEDVKKGKHVSMRDTAKNKRFTVFVEGNLKEDRKKEVPFGHREYVIRKYDGDDAYSYAVFDKDSIPKGRRGGPIFYGEAKPLVSGLSRKEAQYYKKKLFDKNKRQKTSPKELDFYLPDYKLGHRYK